LKKKITLQNSIDIPNLGIGISTGFVDYKLAWEINQHLNVNLNKLSDKLYIDKKNNREFNLSVYYFKNSESEKIFLIKLKYDGIILIPGLKNFDYILMAEYTEEQLKIFLSKLTKLNIQGGCFLLQLNETHKSVLRKIIF
jgi:hypothetical protein